VPTLCATPSLALFVMVVTQILITPVAVLVVTQTLMNVLTVLVVIQILVNEERPIDPTQSSTKKRICFQNKLCIFSMLCYSKNK
jgi:hypothetical protein